MIAASLALSASGCTGGMMPPACAVDDSAAPLARVDIGRAWSAHSMRFIVLGDAGTGYQAQADVGTALRTYCAELGNCQLALYLGDNVYPSGLSSDRDEREAQLDERFSMPYAGLDLPFYVVVGNHDHGFRGLSLGHALGCSDAFDTALLEVGMGHPGAKNPAACALGARGRSGAAWCMPALDYAVDTRLAGFVALDTTPLLWDRAGSRLAQKTVTARRYLHQLASKPWRFLFTHHPFRSIGKHGEAGAYGWIEGYDEGKRIRTLYERLSPDVDVIFNGHDHHLELRPRREGCGEPATVVSGAGGKTSAITRNAGEVEAVGGAAEEKPGFFSVRIDERQLEIELRTVEAGASVARAIWCAEKSSPSSAASWRRGACVEAGPPPLPGRLVRDLSRLPAPDVRRSRN
jgi:tartrate-resistant acid phosphatase type 5